MAFASPGITTINGQPLPGKLTPLQNPSIMIDTLMPDGKRLLVTTGTRQAGTRAPIHTHDHGGYTCVLRGEITIFMEGHAPMKAPAGSCYYMPAGHFMAAANLGSEDVLLSDHFIAPPDAPVMTVLSSVRVSPRLSTQVTVIGSPFSAPWKVKTR
mgnify:CR=1 FL=1